MTVIKLCGIAVIGVCAALIMRAAKSELAMPVGVITGIIILASAISSMYPIVAFCRGIIAGKFLFALFLHGSEGSRHRNSRADRRRYMQRQRRGGCGVETGVCRQGGHTSARTACGTRNFISDAKKYLNEK